MATCRLRRHAVASVPVRSSAWLAPLDQRHGHAQRGHAFDRAASGDHMSSEHVHWSCLRMMAEFRPVEVCLSHTYP